MYLTYSFTHMSVQFLLVTFGTEEIFYGRATLMPAIYSLYIEVQAAQ